MDWQPIETAPKDGTEVDLYVRPWTGKARRVMECWWTPVTGWRNGDKSFLETDRWRITHWRPCPPPPKGC